MFESEDQIRNIKFDLRNILLLQNRGVIITVCGKDHKLVPRLFTPYADIDEDLCILICKQLEIPNP